MSDRLGKLATDQQTATDHATDPIAIGGRAPAREDIADVLGGKLDALPRDVRDTRHIPLGIYRGLRFGLVLHPQFPPSVFLEGVIARQSALSRDHHGPRAVLNSLERFVGGYGTECVRLRQDLAIAESQLRDYQARLGKPFVHERYLAELTALRDQLKAGLSATSHQPAEGDKPFVLELADRIKALKAANSIEAAPQRIRQKQATAEEPVTARILRRAERLPMVGPASDSDEPAAFKQPSEPTPPITTETTFQDRLALERQHTESPERTV